MKKFSFLLIAFLSFQLNPFAQQGWTLLNSGTTSILYSVDFLTENSGWIAGNDLIIKQTRDGGQSWTNYFHPSYFHTWSSLSFATEDEVYVCGKFNINGFDQSNWMFTTDAGNTWVPQSGTILPDVSAWTNVFFLNENLGWKVGYRNGDGRVNKTTTGVGDVWHSLTTVPQLLYSVMFVNENLGWMVGSGGAIYNSIDGGISWTPQNSGTTKSLRSVYFISPLIGWCAGYWDDQAIILKTTNGGQSWSPTLPPNIKELHAIYFWDTSIGWACGSISSTPNDKGVILYTDNGGDTWEEQHIENNCTALYDIDFVNDTTGWAVGSSGVLLKTKNSEDDLQFASLADMNYARYGLGYTSDGTNIYAICGGLGEAPWKSTSIEKYDRVHNTWTEIVTNLIPKRYCSAEYVPSQNKIYIFNGDTYTSSTYTDTVEIIDVGTAGLSYSASNPYPVEYGGSAVWNNKIYSFGGSNSGGYSNRLYEFDPLSNSWTRLPDMPEAKQTNGEIVNGVLYVFGGFNGSTSRRIDAYNIQNSTWTYLGDMPVGISAHATVASEKNVWIVGSFNDIKFLAVYDTETNNFTQLSSDMIGRRHTGATVVENKLYVFGGNQASTDESTLKSLEFADLLIVGGVDDEVNHVINHFTLNQNYPNPFNPNTVISYQLPVSGNVLIKVYDVLGNEIATLVNEEKPAGTYEVEFDGNSGEVRNLPSGVYFYRLQAVPVGRKADDFIQTRKMVLLK